MKPLILVLVLASLGISIFKVVHVYKQEKIARLYCNEQITPLGTPQNISPDKINVLLIGDSRIQKWGQPYFGENVDVFNLGVGGATSGEILCKLKDTVFEISPTWFIIQVGVNDLVATSMMEYKKRSETLDSLLHNLREIIQHLSTTDNDIIVMTMVPPIKPDMIRRFLWGEGINNTAEKISNALLSEMTDNIIVYDMKKIFYDNKRKVWRKEFAADALHWNKGGYDILTKEMKKIISPKKTNDISISSKPGKDK